jgi:UDP-4-amino-4,6-dideoxy-N-acetyl-beta-L-altrosamine transaminase
MIPYGRQHITEADIEAVVSVLRSDFLTQGPAIRRFEQAVADYCGADCGVAVNSATSGLHIACQALDLGPGDWLWTAPNTFVSSANCGRFCGASIDFVDTDPQTYNMSVEQLSAKLEAAERQGCLPKVVVPVHFAGQPCDMPAIGGLAKQYGFRVIEDASHAIGATCRGEPVGRCDHSDITVFSFHPVKIITTGEGGMAMTNDEGLAERLRRLRTHGITRDPQAMEGPSDGPWYYEQFELGENYRMTDLAAALGASQLERIDQYIVRRHEVAKEYDRALADLPVTTPWRDPADRSALHLYPILINENAGKTRREVFEILRSAGLGVNVHYIPVHTHPDYQQLGFRAGQFPAAEAYYERAISIPIFGAMTGEEQAMVLSALKKALT